MSAGPYSAFSTRVTKQSEPIPGELQVRNNAGGFVYQLDKWQTLERFLILGTEGGTYYQGEAKLTKEGATNALACLAEDGKRFVQTVVGISDSGRAAKNDPAIFALALAASGVDLSVRRFALANLSKVCRIPTHLFHFCEYISKLRGWGRGLRRAVGDWYLTKPVDELAYAILKYQQRDGWSHRDVLRKAHPTASLPPVEAVLRWAVGASADAREVVSTKHPTRTYPAITAELPAIIDAHREAQSASPDVVIRLIEKYNLSREMIPSELLTRAEIWEALLQKMPPHALLRNLGNMSKVGLLTPFSNASGQVVGKLTGDPSWLKKNRVHPLAVLIALKVYASGQGVKGDGTWIPDPAVTDALDTALYLAFDAFEPTGKKILYGLDVSGSMGWSFCANGLINCAEGAAVMALASAKAEAQTYIMGFCHDFRDLGITPRMRLHDVLVKMSNLPFGATDCSVPALWAIEKKADIDAIVVLTDNETWAGKIHPSQALGTLRANLGKPVKQIVVGMTATPFTIANPSDSLSMDVVGFDANAPAAIAEFIRL